MNRLCARCKWHSARPGCDHCAACSGARNRIGLRELLSDVGCLLCICVMFYVVLTVPEITALDVAAQ